jgi:hypothetical protein
MAARPLERGVIVRILGGLAVVPAVIGVLTFFVFLALANIHVLPYTPNNPIHSARAIAIAVGMLAVVVTAVVAFPAVVVLGERGPLPLAKLLGLGALLGNLPLALIILVATLVNLYSGTLDRGRDLYHPVGTFVRVMIGLACGMTGAAVFWFISIRGTELDEAAE